MGLYLPILLGTVREERRSEWIARFAAQRLAARPGIETRLFDPRELPFENLREREWEMDPRPAAVADFVAEMARADGFLIVAPEYNHGYPGTLKNMLDAMEAEWARKPFGIIGVGGISGGIRMTEQLRLVIAGLGAIAVPLAVPVQHVGKSWGPEGPTDQTDWGARFDKLFVEVAWYADALRSARQTA